MTQMDQMMQRMSKTYSNATRTPELVIRWGISLAVFATLLIPAGIALLQWMNEVLSFDAKDYSTFAWSNYFFEAMVIMLVFFFAVAILFALTTDAPELEFNIILVGVGLAILGVGLENEITKRCLIDLDCNPTLYLLALGIVVALSLVAYILMKAIRIQAPWLAVLFLAEAWWQADVWIFFHAMKEPGGIKPTDGALRGVLLLFFSVFWMMLFATMQKREKKPKKE